MHSVAAGCTMGCRFSEPISREVDSGGYVCMVLRASDKFRLLHAPDNVIVMVARILGEMSGGSVAAPSTDKFGAAQFHTPGRPFVLNSSKDNATIGKVFAIRILEEMHMLGYDLVTSADLSRLVDQSTWYFRKSSSDLSRRRLQSVVCVAPGGSDKLVVLERSDTSIVQAMRDVLAEVWTLGLQREEEIVSRGEKVHKFKLRGNPWFGQDLESTLSRKLLLAIVSRLEGLRWRLLAATSLKGGTDSLFFIRDEELRGSGQFAAVSFNRLDRLRMLDFEEESKVAVRDLITKHQQEKEPEERDYYGAHEFKLKGGPFGCVGKAGIATRRLICHLLETLCERGWECVTSVDLSRKLTDKSVLLFRRCERIPETRLACVAMGDARRIRLVDFPEPVRTAMREAIGRHYLPGVSKSTEENSCCKLTLKGYPWSGNSVYGLHARSMLAAILAVAEANGWRLVISADVSATYVQQKDGPDYPYEVQSWWFCKESVVGQQRSTEEERKPELGQSIFSWE